MTTENIERVEIVRGPFSALYGSDAIGGVIQIFTRTASQGLSGRATAEAGNQGQSQGSAFVSAGEGPFSATGAYRYAAFDGDRPNTDWRQRNGSASLEARLAGGGRVAVEGSILDGEVGNPGPVGAPSTARGTSERSGSPSRAASRSRTRIISTSCSRTCAPSPAFATPTADSPLATDAETLQARVADTARIGAHSVTVLALLGAVEGGRREQLRNEPRRAAHRRSGAPACRTRRPWVPSPVTAGVRFDHHSVFGDAWSPRRHDRVALPRLALEGAGLGRRRVSRADGRRALLSRSPATRT